MTAPEPTLPPERVAELAEALHDAMPVRYASWGGLEQVDRHFFLRLANGATPLIAGWLAEAEGRVVAVKHDSTCDWATDDAWCSCGLDDAFEAGYRAGAAEVRVRVEAVDFNLRRLGTVAPDLWIDGWNRALNACQDDLRAALAEPKDRT